MWLSSRRRDGEVHLVSFHEELPTAGAGHVVPRESARIDGYKSVPLHDNHTGICKFDNFKDPKYVVVLSILQEWMEKIKIAGQDDVPKAVSSTAES